MLGSNGNINLTGARIGNDIGLTGVYVGEDLRLQNTSIGGDVYLNTSVGRDVDLGAKLGKSVRCEIAKKAWLLGATVAGNLYIGGARIGEGLIM